MPHWVVELGGESAIVRQWASLFPPCGDVPSVTEWAHNEVRRWVLVHETISSASTPVQSYRKAADLVTIMSHIAVLEGVEPVWVGIVYDQANPGYRGMIAATMSVTLPMPIVSAVLSTRQSTVTATGSHTAAQKKLLAYGANDHFRDAVAYLAASSDWVALYKSLEALRHVKADGAWACISKKNWERLKRTANEHRHHEAKPAAENPMPHHEAVAYIRAMIDEAACAVLKCRPA